MDSMYHHVKLTQKSPQWRRSCGCSLQRSQMRSTAVRATPIDRRHLLAGSLIVGSQLSLACGSIAQQLAPTAPAEVASQQLSAVPKAELAPGFSVSQVVKGCWQLSGAHRELLKLDECRGDSQTDRTSGRAAVEDFNTFYAAGITSFDAADHYGPAERLIGEWLAQDSGALRPQVQLLTKYCVFSNVDMITISKDAVAQAVDTSRGRLGAQAVDLMQLYWADYSIPRYVDAARHLADLQAEGRIRHIGLTNFDVPRVQAIMDAGVPVVSNQVQYSLLDRRPENFMAPFCLSRGVSLLPYGVLAGGLLSGRYLGVPASDVQVDTASKGKYARVLGEVGGWKWFQSLLQVLDSIGRKHGVSVSNVAARWVLQRPAVPAIILGARNARHVQDHQLLFSFSLDDDDQAAINEVLAKERRPQGDCYSWERGGQW